MFNLQGSEIIFILLLALVVLGPEKLPGAIRRFTRTYAELKKMGNSFQEEVRTAFDEPMREVRETADLIKQQVDVDAIEAEHDAEQHRAAPTSEVAGEDPGSDDDADLDGQGQHPDTAYRPMQPPVAGTARPGLPPPPDDESPVSAPPQRSAIPTPPPPFASSAVPSSPPPTSSPGDDEGVSSP